MLNVPSASYTCANHPHMIVGPGKAARLFHKEAKLPLVYIEAVANAIDWNADEVSITIRYKKANIKETLTIEVKDNGDGIDDQGFYRFLHVNEPADNAHRGIGRLAFVSNFSKVSVVSRTTTELRRFAFDETMDQCKPTPNDLKETGTTILMASYSKGRVRDNKFIAAESVKALLLKEFFPLLHHKKVSGAALRIIISEFAFDEEGIVVDTTKAILDLSELPLLTEVDFDPTPAMIPEGMKLLYHINREYAGQSVICGFNIDGRSYTVNSVSEANVPAGTQAIFLLYSPYFNGRTDETREFATIDEEDITKLKKRLAHEVDLLLKNEIPAINDANEAVKTEVKERYPHLGHYFPEDTAGLIVRQDVIDKATDTFVRNQQVVLDAIELSEEQLGLAMEMGARVLMQYILFRNKTLEQLDQISDLHSENVMHNLLVPRFKAYSQEDEDIYSNNAWVLDEKFMAYSFVLSDKKLRDFVHKVFPDAVANHVTGEPDIAVLMSKDITGASHNDIVVVEMKKLGVKIEKEAAVITQLTTRAMDILDYFNPTTQRLWLFGIVEVTPIMRRILITEGWSPLYSTGQYWHTTRDVVPTSGGAPVPTQFYIIPYRTLISDAKLRNGTFMDLLKRTIKKPLPSLDR